MSSDIKVKYTYDPAREAEISTVDLPTYDQYISQTHPQQYPTPPQNALPQPTAPPLPQETQSVTPEASLCRRKKCIVITISIIGVLVVIACIVGPILANRFKSTGPESQQNKASTRGTWLAWQEWGVCSHDCNRGTRKRTRGCSIKSRCDGYPYNTEDCNTFPCGNCAGPLATFSFTVPNMCIALVKTNSSHLSSPLKCAQMGGDMLAITSANMNQGVYTYLLKYSGWSRVHIDGSRRYNQSHYVSQGGQMLNYFNWNSGQPSRPFPEHSCIDMSRQYQGRWDDISCDLEGPILCGIITREDCSTATSLKHGDKCVKFHRAPKSRTEAENVCRLSNNGVFLHVTSWNMQQHVYEFVKKQAVAVVRIDGIAKKGSSEFQKSNEDLLTYYNWNNSSKQYNTGQKEMCLEINRIQDGIWNIDDCNKPKAFLCQEDICTDPALTKLEDACVIVIKQRQSQFQSTGMCRHRGSNIMQITSIDMQNRINDYLDNRTNEDVWIAGQRHAFPNILPNNFYIPRVGPLNYTNWAPGQPDNATGNEACIQMKRSTSGLWNDIDCNTRLQSLCGTLIQPPQFDCFGGTDGHVSARYGDLCIFIRFEYQTNAAAAKRCESFGGQLAHVSSEDKSKVIDTFAFRDGAMRWINGRRVAGTNRFVTTKGETMNYTFWADREPNNKGGNEDCIALFDRLPRWNDVSCDTKLIYVCERPIQYDTTSGP